MLKSKKAKAKVTHKIDWNHNCENTARAGTKIHKRSSHICHIVQIC